MAVVDTQKRGIGVFSSREVVEAALNELKNSDFPMDKVSVVGRDSKEGEEIVNNPDEFIRDKTTEGLGKGALTGSAIGGLSGLLVGLSTLVIPGLGHIFFAGSQAALIGTLVGGFYGAVGGTILGGILGNGVSNEEAKIYSDRLSDGNYLLIVDGTQEEIDRAEPILKDQAIRDWGVYNNKPD